MISLISLDLLVWFRHVLPCIPHTSTYLIGFPFVLVPRTPGTGSSLRSVASTWLLPTSHLCRVFSHPDGRPDVEAVEQLWTFSWILLLMVGYSWNACVVYIYIYICYIYRNMDMCNMCECMHFYMYIYIYVYLYYVYLCVASSAFSNPPQPTKILQNPNSFLASKSWKRPVPGESVENWSFHGTEWMLHIIPGSTAQGGSGSFKDRKSIGGWLLWMMDCRANEPMDRQAAGGSAVEL